MLLSIDKSLYKFIEFRDNLHFIVTINANEWLRLCKGPNHLSIFKFKHNFQNKSLIVF